MVCCIDLDNNYSNNSQKGWKNIGTNVFSRKVSVSLNQKRVEASLE